MPARHFTITGYVQGVGFRYAMVHEARRLQLSGWVRNRRDGSVEAVGVGDEDALDQLEQWAERGPPGSTVMDVVTRDANEVEETHASAPFTQRPSA